MSKVRFRGGFSDRNSIKPINSQIQYETLDERSRIKILNLLNSVYESALVENCSYKNSQEFCRFILKEVFVVPVQASSGINDTNIWKEIYECVMNDDYDDVLTLIEACVFAMEKLKSSRYYNTSIYELFNDVFEKEYIGYRFVNCIISPITDKNEIESVEQSLSNNESCVKDHISKALEFLSNRESPDYENSIKESIIAVEAKCSLITGLKGKQSTLSNTLKHLENSGISIHGSLKEAFNKLYGYTNDANGQRHAGDIGGPNSTFREAKFMLVSCSAFINYLTDAQAQYETESN